MRQDHQGQARYLPIGVALGVALGLAFDNLPIGIAVGVALGLAMGMFKPKGDAE